MASNVSLNAHRITQVDGKPFFPIIARHMPDRGNATILSQAGFNAMRWTAFGTATKGDGPAPLPADTADLMIDAYIYNRGDLSADKETCARELTELVNSIKHDPRLLSYEQLNEPAWSMDPNRSQPQGSPEGMAQASKIIRRLDPNHPIHVGHMVCNLVSTLRKYNEAVDIVGCNPYVVSGPGDRHYYCLRDGRYVDCADQTLSAVGQLTSKMMRVAQGRGVWMQLQAMAAENWHNEDCWCELKNTGMYEHIRLYPGVWQMRFMAFNAIIRGATGLAWAMYRTPAHGGVWQDICRVVGELRDLHDVLAGAPVADALKIEYTEMGFSDWDGVETLVKLCRGQPWILAANTQADPMIATFSNLPEGLGTSVSVFKEDRRLDVVDGAFTDRFQPYQVHVYGPCQE